MGVSIEVTQATFATEVLARSRSEVVLVDFFAQWCGPCKMLKPILEELAQDYNFALAKVDIDANPDLAQTYGVEGVPDVRVALNGELQPGFVGMLPEPEIRDFLTQLNLQSTISTQLATAQAYQQAGELKAAGQIYQVLLRDYPTSPAVAIATTGYLIATQQFELAQKLIDQLANVPATYQAQVQALQALMTLKQTTDTSTTTNPTEIEQQYSQAIAALLAQQYEPALTGLIDIVRCDRGAQRNQARQAMLTVFGLLGNDHELTKTYRRQLAQALY